MISFNPISIFMDSRRVTRGTPEMLAARQRERLNELVKFARANSRFYAEKYRGLPETITDVRLFPPVTKVKLMEHFDGVVTRPVRSQSGCGEIHFQSRQHRQTVHGQVHGLDNLWHNRHARHLSEDKDWDAVITAVNVLRMGGEWDTGKVVRGMMKAGGNSASIFAGDGHFLGVTMLERQRASSSSKAQAVQIIRIWNITL